MAVRDLAPGSAVSSTDLRLVGHRARDLPAAALTSAAAVEGQVVAGPVSAGEVLTDARFVGVGLLAKAPAGLLGVHLTAADVGALPMIRPGDRVDVYAVGATSPVATGVLVLAKDSTSQGVSSLVDKGTAAGLVTAVDPAAAARIAAAQAPDAPVGGFTFVLHRRE